MSDTASASAPPVQMASSFKDAATRTGIPLSQGQAETLATTTAMSQTTDTAMQAKAAQSSENDNLDTLKINLTITKKALAEAMRDMNAAKVEAYAKKATAEIVAHENEILRQTLEAGEDSRDDETLRNETQSLTEERYQAMAELHDTKETLKKNVTQLEKMDIAVKEQKMDRLNNEYLRCRDHNQMNKLI